MAKLLGSKKKKKEQPPPKRVLTAEGWNQKIKNSKKKK